MTQASNTEIAASLSSAASSFLAALRNGFDSDAVENDGFSALLSHFTAADEQTAADQTAPQPVAAPQDTAAAANANADTTAQNGPKTDTTQQTATQQDAAPLPEKTGPEDGAALSGSANETATTDAAPATPVQTESPKIALARVRTDIKRIAEAKKEAQTDQTQTVANTASDAATQATTVATSAAPQTKSAQTQASAQTGSDSSAKTDDSATTESLLSNLAAQESAALLLLQKGAEPKSNASKETGSANDEQAAANAPTNANANAGALALQAELSSKEKGFSGLKDQAQTNATAGTQNATDAASSATTGASQTSTATTNGANALSNNTQNSDNGNKIDFTAVFAGLASGAGTSTTAPQTAATATAPTVAGGTGAAGAPTLAATGSSSGASQTAALGATEGARSAGSYDFASQLSSQSAGKGTAGTTASNMIEQVAVQIRKMAKIGQSEVTLQLRPEDLGRVDVKLTFGKDSTVTGTVVADNQATLDMLSKDVGGLQRALQDAGLRADGNSLQFSLRGDGQQNAFAQNQSQQQNANGSSRFVSTSLNVAPTAASDATATVAQYVLTPGRVNLQV
jgi:flagellar hook-length control protein FliK